MPAAHSPHYHLTRTRQRTAQPGMAWVTVCVLAATAWALAVAGVSLIKAGDDTPVTAADFAIQGMISGLLRMEFPHDRFMGEEDAAELRAEPSLCALAQRLCSEFSQGARDAAVDDNLDLPRNLMDEVNPTCTSLYLPISPCLIMDETSICPSLRPYVLRASARAASTRATPSSPTWTAASSRRAARASAAGCSTPSTAPRAS